MGEDSLLELPQALSRPTRPKRARYVMGMDGGATKTLAAVLDLERHELHLARGGSSNEDAIGLERAVEVLLEVAEEALARATITDAELGAAVLAVAGIDTGALARRVASARGDWIVVNDVVAAWAAATGGDPGVAAIAGTGSNVFGVGADGRTWRAGGWGHLLGDEGSGYWLGTHSISAGLHTRDGSGPRTGLGEAAAAFFGVDSIEALAALVYSKPLDKGEIAAFATETARLAQQGDAVARELYQRGAAELARQILTVIERTGLGVGGSGPEPFPVGLLGSAWRAGPLFTEPLAEAVLEGAPGARVAIVQMAPVGGSLLLAARACGQRAAIDTGLLQALIS